RPPARSPVLEAFAALLRKLEPAPRIAALMLELRDPAVAIDIADRRADVRIRERRLALTFVERDARRPTARDPVPKLFTSALRGDHAALGRAELVLDLRRPTERIRIAQRDPALRVAERERLVLEIVLEPSSPRARRTVARIATDLRVLDPLF